MAEIIQNYELQQKLPDGEILTLHVKTNADIVEETDIRVFLTPDLKLKLEGIEAGAQVNKVESISVNGITQPVVGKNIELTILPEAGVELRYIASTGVLQLLDEDENILSEVDLPLELIVTDGYYDETTSEIVLVLANNGEIRIPAASLIDIYTADEDTLTLEGKQFRISDSFQDKIQTIIDDITAIQTNIVEIEDSIEDIVDGTTPVLKAKQFDSNKTINLTGDATATITTNFASSTVSSPITLASTGVVAGIYSVVQVDEKGRAVAGSQIIEIGNSGQTAPSSDLVIGGLFYKRI